MRGCLFAVVAFTIITGQCCVVRPKAQDCQERDPLRPDTPRPQCQNSPHDGHRPAVCPVSSFSQVRDQLTLLAAAAKAGSWRIVDLLLNAGANSTQDWQRPDGATAVSLAAAGTQREPPL